MRLAIFLLSTFLTTACTAPRTATQKLDITSGEVAVPGEVEVTGVSFIRFNDDNAKFDRSVSLLAEHWLNRKNQNAETFLAAFVGEVSEKVAESIETEVRRRKCIYTVSPTTPDFLETINSGIASSTLTDPDRIFDRATPEELARLENLSDDAFDIEFARLLAKYGLNEQGSQNNTTSIAVASQCLIDVHVGDTLRAFKFQDRLAISRKLN